MRRMLVLGGALLGCHGPTSPTTADAPPSVDAAPVDAYAMTIPSAITLPADPSVIVYPDDYVNAVPAAVTVDDPYCAIKRDHVTFPASYLGAFPLPAIKGAPLPTAIPRGVHLKDYWISGLHDAATNPGCGGDLHAAYRETIRRAKLLGADHIAFYQDAWPVDATATPPVFDVDISEVPPAEIAFIVSEAKAQGLAVHEYMQINAGDHHGGQLPATTPSAAYAGQFLDSYTDFIVGQAAYAQQVGIDAFQLDWGAYWFDWTPHASLLNQKMAAAADKVRAVYSGKIIYGTLEPSVQGDPTVLAKVDWLLVDLYGVTLDAAENAAISTAQLEAKYEALIAASPYATAGKPAVFRLYIQSHRNYLRDGWVEDGFCVPSPAQCSQLALTTDFSVQAIGTEAMLEAITTQKTFPIAAVASQAWFYTDVILPQSAQPNISQSVRDKPAEVITYRWFKR